VVAVKFLVDFLLKKKINFIYFIFPAFIVSASAPFVYWKYRFVDYDEKFVAACEAETYVKIYNDPPKDLVAFQSENIEKYTTDSSRKWHNIKRYGLNSVVVYDRSGKKAIDGIANQWKKLTLVDRSDKECNVFEGYVSGHPKYSNQRENGIPEQCLVVKVLDSIDNVNFIDTIKSIDVMYSDDSFSISRHHTKIVNSRTNEMFIEVQQVLAGFPRFPNNFYAGFISWAKPCLKANQFREDKIQGPAAKSIIFNEQKVKELKEKGYGI
jgi:hypothetical protein